MTGISDSEVRRRIEELGAEQPWHHNIELRPGLWTAPHRKETLATNLGKWARLQPIIDQLDLRSAKVLDVGCSDGFYALQLARAGAANVVAIEINELRLHKCRFVQEVTGAGNITFTQIGVDDVGEDVTERFRVTLCLGFLHRFPDPYRLLTKLAKLSEVVLLEWKVTPDDNVDQPTMRLATAHRRGIDDYNISYFHPTVSCVREILGHGGLQNHYRIDDGRSKRVAMISARNPLNLDPHSYVSAPTPKIKLLFKYSRLYLRSVTKVLFGRVGY